MQDFVPLEDSSILRLSKSDCTWRGTTTDDDDDDDDDDWTIVRLEDPARDKVELSFASSSDHDPSS